MAMQIDSLPTRARDMSRDDERIGPYDLADIKQSITDLTKYKGGSTLQWFPQAPPTGAIAETWKMALDKVAPPLLQIFNSSQALGAAPQRFKDGETAHLRKPKGDGKSAANDYRTISLINHIGKVFARVTTLEALRGVSRRISATQYGAMPGRSTRDAVAVATEVISRHQQAHRVRVRGRAITAPPMLLVILTDLEKAFDMIDRQSIWDRLADIQLRPDARETIEELHDGMCYLYRDVRTRLPVSRIQVQRGVRQGGVESPGLFVAAYDKLVATLAERQREMEYPGIQIYYDPSLKRTRNNDELLADTCENLDVTHLMFLDFDEATLLLDLVNGKISHGGMKVHARKTELLLIPSGTGSKRRQKLITSHTTGIVTWQDDDALPIHPQPTVKYLGVRLAVTGSYQTEITHRLPAANQAFRLKLSDLRPTLQPHLVATQPLLMASMFQPIAEVQVANPSQKRAAAVEVEDEGEGGDVVGPLAKALAKLALQHEDLARASHRDDNFAMVLKPQSALENALEQALVTYEDKGRKAKEKPTEQDSTYLGHPLGKRPDALAMAVVFRIAEAVVNKKNQVVEAATQSLDPEAAKAALEVIIQMGKLAQDQQAKFVATRCFRIKLNRDDKGESQDEGEVKWIFALNHYPTFKLALNTLRTNGALAAAGINLQYDIATRSRAAKLVESLAVKKG
ncbi:unnamed protein product, partial [Prorocentrum cordatum]